MDVTDWLLDSDPAIRWQVLRDLTDEPPEAAEAERARVTTEGWGAALLALQDEKGYWGGDEYGEDRKSVHWTLQSLRRFGIDPDAASVASAVKLVHDNVVWHYWDDLPYFSGEVEPCINGGVLASAAYFGALGEGSDRIIARLLSEQLEDGGWNCETESSKASFDTTLCVLEGLAEYERAASQVNTSEETDADRVVLTAVTTARHRGEEYLLEHNLFRRLSTGEVVLPRYGNLSFPPYWFYDILRALDYFRSTGQVADPRVEDAIDKLVGQRQDDGRWLAGQPWPGEVFFALDAPEDEPSRWNTLRALRVLRWWDGELG